jgi:hypothetical protein
MRGIVLQNLKTFVGGPSDFRHQPQQGRSGLPAARRYRAAGPDFGVVFCHNVPSDDASF